MKYITLALAIFLLSCSTHPENHELRLNLEGKKYEQVVLRGSGPNDDISINGTSKDGYQWLFQIPDSVYQVMSGFKFRYKDIDCETNTLYYMFFKFKEDDSRFGPDMVFEKGTTQLYGRYMKSEVVNDIPTSGCDGKFVMATVHIDYFLLGGELGSECELVGRYPSFSLFEYDSLSYSDALDKYASAVRLHPDSRLLITRLAETMSFYKDSNDLKKVYNGFSEQNRESYWGKQIKEHLEKGFGGTDFPNMPLPTLGNRTKYEDIIQETNRFNLVVFSASWCGPCRAEIPLLKEIYSDLNSQLTMTYISTDDETSLPNWLKLMEAEHIPWRSLLAVDDVKGIQKKYLVEGIPHAILVHPGGKRYDVIDVREKDGKEKLYRLVQNK